MNLFLMDRVRISVQQVWPILFVWAIATTLSSMWIFRTDWQSLGWQDHDFAQTTATVLSTTSAKYVINNDDIYAYDYTFQLDGNAWEGTSYSSDEPGEVGTQMLVNYLKKDPATSFLDGMRREPSPIWVGLLSLSIFFLPAQLLLGYKIWQLVRAIQTVADGELALATFSSKREVQVYIRTGQSYRRHYRMYYHFEVNGKTYEASFSTNNPASYQQEEWVVYDPKRPTFAQLIKRFPAKIQRRFAAQIPLTAQPTGVTQDLRLYELWVDHPALKFEADEAWLWAGNAVPGLRWTDINPANTISGLFLIAFMGFMISRFWGMDVSSLGSSDIVLVLGFGLFLGLGFWLSLGQVIGKLIRRRKTHYVLTTHQLIRIRRRKATAWQLAMLDLARVKPFADGAGQISFGPNHVMHPIADPQHVNGLLHAQQHPIELLSFD